MLQFEFFALRWETTLLRYYLLMALPIVGGFTGQWWIGLFALPVFLSAITGLKITLKGKESTAVKGSVAQKANVIQMAGAPREHAGRTKTA